MSLAPLSLAALGTTVAPVVRSGIRWIHDDGHICRPHEIVGWCNVRVGVPDVDGTFADEARDLQIAFATRVAGTLKRGADTSRGGFLDRLPELERWQAGQTIGHVETSAGDAANGDALRPLFVAGRRVVEVAEDRSGLLTGWHDRLRAWWGDGDTPPSTLMGLGICDQSTLFRGDAEPFHEWFAAARGPAHVVFVPDHVLAPCAAVLTEQLGRTRDEVQAIRDDFTQSFAKLAPSPEDWMLAGSLLAAVLRSPLNERLEVLGPAGIVPTRGVDALVLSLNAEQPRLWRHKTLGYAVSVHGYRLKEAGPALTSWLLREFESVRQGVDDARRDYDALIAALRAHGVGAILVMNAMSTSSYEDVTTYASYDAPLSSTLGSVRAKELNLMLHDVSRAHDVSIVDNDAMAAELGSARHLTDGVHGSGALHAALRADILRILRERGVAGFAAV
ncbi:MAG TPA: hypothetical protein VII68_15705 [Casimicrobiaceae bacterium]